MSELSISEVLDLTADRIEEVGWNCGVLSWSNRFGGGFCIEGAMAAVLGIDLTKTDEAGFWEELPKLRNHPAYKAAALYIGTNKSLSSWNDADGRTKEVVIEALRGAAVRERAREVVGMVA